MYSTSNSNTSNGNGSFTNLSKPNTSSVIIDDGKTLKYNDRVLWPQIIREPLNKWIYSVEEIIEKLNKSSNLPLHKKKIERTLLFFYKMKSALNLQEQTYVTACILFYRFWITYDLPEEMNDCMDVALSVLVTACKCAENNRPIRAYVDTAVTILNSGVPMNQQKLEKIKWIVRERFSSNEMKFIALMNFDFDACNPRQFIEEVFNVQYKLSRDKDLPKEFEAAFPSILREARVFIYQTEAQPVSLLCDGITYIIYALIFAGIQYKTRGHDSFKFPKNFFAKRFPNSFDASVISELANSHYRIEKTFLKMGSNKGDLLLMTTDDIRDLVDEDCVTLEGTGEEIKNLEPKNQNLDKETSEAVATAAATSSESEEPLTKKQCVKKNAKSISDFYYMDVSETVCDEFLKYTEEKILAIYKEESAKAGSVPPPSSAATASSSRTSSIHSGKPHR